MTPGQITLVAASILLTASLYLFGPLKSSEKKEQSVAVETADTFDFAKFKEEELARLPADSLPTFKQLEVEAMSLEAGEKSEKLSQLITFLQSNRLHILSAFYQKDIAEAENTDSSWVLAGQGFYSVAFATDDQALNKHLLSQSIGSYKKAVELNPENTEAKMNMAIVYLEGPTDQVMNGVMILREITDKDPDNITANLILGRYGIVSGQFDKAVQRLEKVLSLDSLNAEAYLYLAEAYESLGERAKAIEMLEKCKTIVKSPGFSEEVDNYILKLKNS